MNVSLALRYWDQIESTMAPHVSLASPACIATDGEWMREFMSILSLRTAQRQQSRCGDESHGIDYVAVHWYGSPDVDTFQTEIAHYYGLYNRSLMITEFAVADWTADTVEGNRFSQEEVLAFMQAALPWLESQDWIIAYSWFPFEITDPVGTSSSLFDRHGNLTKLGSYYKTVHEENPSGNQSMSVY
jgi:hypothetical protein